MIDLFGSDGRAAVERLARQRTLYAFDFDGTLAPIVERPSDARAGDTTVARMTALAVLVPTVLITGRSVADLRQRIDFTPLHLVGNHGAEGVPDPLHRSIADSVGSGSGDAAHREVVRGWLAQWPLAVATQRADPGIVIEPKAYSLSIHYRKSDDHDAARRTIASAIARLDPPPRIIGGKCVFNLLPEGAPDKGSALRSLVQFEQCDAAFFIGDDLTDEAAFVDAPSSWVTVRVGAVADSAARYFIADQRDIDRCIDLLVATAGAQVARSRQVV
ncbi:MAG: trehalose-phosphatase [Burkholderiaceae bacterium]